jgi:hypothetical protein
LKRFEPNEGMIAAGTAALTLTRAAGEDGKSLTGCLCGIWLIAPGHSAARRLYRIARSSQATSQADQVTRKFPSPLDR